jgi:hypothetical protein
MHWPRYLWKAFNVRPFGMPVPPLWFAVVASGLVGWFIAPPLALIGLGGTAMFTGILASSKRFRTAVDAPLLMQAPVQDDKLALLNRLDDAGRLRQAKLEKQCTELQKVLETAKAGREHINGVWQLAGLHLKMLVARMSASAVSDSREDGGKSLEDQLAELKKRLSAADIDADLKSALEDQQQILEQRLAMQTEAKRRLQVLDAELDRIREQIALIREQALLTSDPASISRSVDSLATFLNESGRWLKDQEEIFGDIGELSPTPYVSGLTDAPKVGQRNSKRVGETQ